MTFRRSNKTVASARGCAKRPDARRPKQAIFSIVDAGQRSRWPLQPAKASRVLLGCLKFIQYSLDTLLKLGTLVSTVGILLAVTIQAFSRLCLPSAPAWTEEAARFCFLFSVAFAAPLALRDQAFVRVDTLAHCLPAQVSRWLRPAIDLAIMVLMMLVSAASISFVQLGMGQQSPCLKVPMAWVHGALLLLSSMTAVYAGIEVYRDLRPGDSTEPHS
ncbi:MAG: TRAP transporter small permease [Phycisphaerae bacterium]|nr:TRAP transporter small permease [Phycisphaerae bacterium]